MIKKIFKAGLQKLFYAIARVTPKSDTVVLRGFPDYDDNLVAIYQGLVARGTKRIVWVLYDPATPSPIDLGSEVRLVKQGSLLDVLFSLSARFLFITHGHFLTKTPPNQICINLWHGIPFKRIGRALGDPGRDDTMLVATSEFTKRLLADAFDMPQDRVVITGQARTDRLFELSKDEFWRRVFPQKPLPDKIYLWLPTYRQSSYLPGQTDGHDLGNVFNCSDFSEETFNAFLAANNSVCFVKPHPMAPKSTGGSYSHLKFINETWMAHHRLTLYQFLGAVDCLISDISSVITDFLIVDRPIILLFEDIDAYNDNRGFMLDPVTDYLPAKVTRNFAEFMSEMNVLHSDADYCRSRRDRLCKMFFDYRDDHATDRILNFALNHSKALRKSNQ